MRAQLREAVFFGGPGCKSIVLIWNGGLPALSSVTDTSVPVKGFGCRPRRRRRGILGRPASESLQKPCMAGGMVRAALWEFERCG